MGGFSIWHWLIVLLVVGPCFLPLIIRSPQGLNRFGPAPEANTFVTAVQTVFTKFFDLSGRASRSEFWYFYLFQLLVSVALQIATSIAPDVAIPVLLLNIGLALPFIALTTRRLHDRNRSGWWQLLIFTGIGGLVLLVWSALPSKDET